MQNIREKLAQIMTENADPVGLVDEMRRLFVLYGDSQELDSKVCAAYLDAARKLDDVRYEFTRRGIR